MLFLIYINNVSDDLTFNAKLFADNASLFSVVEKMTKPAKELNNDLTKVSTWVFQWKMNFNPDPTKQAQEVIFSRYLQNTNHPCLIFNHNSVGLTKSLKHLGIVLDSRLDLKERLEIIFKKISKTIGLLRRLQNLLPRKSLIKVYKFFTRPHMDYGDIIMTKPITLLFIEN